MTVRYIAKFPRIPLKGHLDFTYRCNNNCRHCWLWEHPKSNKMNSEITTEKMMSIIDQARNMGCQAWAISGGEPMLREDFCELFDYITKKSVDFSLNTNGTLITPIIARLLARRGHTMVALYGATAEVHDFITRNPGSFEATMSGFSYLKEAGAVFSVQLVPMRANLDQYKDMQLLAQSISINYRNGAPWLWLSADHNPKRNEEILEQRLDPSDVVMLDNPNFESNSSFNLDCRSLVTLEKSAEKPTQNDSLFANCINSRNDFHIDPYGTMSFCSFVKDTNLRADLHNYSFLEVWDEFIPSLIKKVYGGKEYLQGCGRCKNRHDCKWCAVFGHLEHGRYSAIVEYLCQITESTIKYKDDQMKKHTQHFQIGGVTLCVTSDFPIVDGTFDSLYNIFKTSKKGIDEVKISLHSPVPDTSKLLLEKEVFRNAVWAIYRSGTYWIYIAVDKYLSLNSPNLVAIFNNDFTDGHIYNHVEVHKKGGFHSISTMVSDQIPLASMFAHKKACYIHSAGFILNGKGLLFVGHSEAGKSTILKMLHEEGEILCDDRNIIREYSGGITLFGTWSHGELPDVSPNSAPLKAIMYLEKAEVNELIPITDKRDRLGRILSHVVRPLVTDEWWENILILADKIATEVPAYRLKFDKSGKVVNLIKGNFC